MFSQQERCIYHNNQLAEVICQFRFPTILTINAQPPAAFQEEIRDVFPKYRVRPEQPPLKITPIAGQPPKIETQPAVNNYEFFSMDGSYRVNLTQNFISLSCSRYTRWEDFARRMDQALAAFIRQYQPACFERVGLRYVNAFSRQKLDLENAPWTELLKPSYLGLLADNQLPETAYTRCTQEVEASLPGGCRMKLHVGPGMLKRGTNASDQEVKLIFDLDVSMSGNVPVNLAAASMQTIHTHAGSIFRDAITDPLHDAMDPE